MEIALHHPPSLPFPSVLCLAAFQSNTSCCCCFLCTLPDAVQGGWWRCETPPPRLFPRWNAVDSKGWPLVSSYIPPSFPSPASVLHLQQRSETSSNLNKETGKYILLKCRYMIGGFFFSSVVCTGNEVFPQCN